MDTASQEPVGEELERIRDVDGDASIVWLHVFPFALWCAHLECCDGLSVGHS